MAAVVRKLKPKNNSHERKISLVTGFSVTVTVFYLSPIFLLLFFSESGFCRSLELHQDPKFVPLESRLRSGSGEVVQGPNETSSLSVTKAESLVDPELRHRQIRHHHHQQARHAQNGQNQTVEGGESVKIVKVESVDEEGPAQDSPDLNGTISSSLETNSSIANDWGIVDSENFPDGYWIKVALAKVMTLAVENGTLPRLDENSQIMKPAGCRKEHDLKCLEFTSTCAERVADELLKQLHENGDGLSTKENLAIYMNYIWKECGMAKNSNYQGDFQDVDLQSQILNPPKGPLAMFHCSSRKSSEITEVNFRMEYPSLQQEILTSDGFPTNISTNLIPRYFVIELYNGRGQWLLPSKAVQAFWLFRFKTRTHEQVQIRVTAVSPSYIYPPVISTPIRIYSAKQLLENGPISQPTDLRVVSISVDKFAARPSPSALLRWKSGSGLNASCDYDVFFMDDDMLMTERKKGDDAFWVKLDNLHFGRNYTLRVIEKFGGGLEADVHSNLNIPTCLELRGFSFELCPPPPPSNVRMVNATDTSFWIVWTPPKYVNSSNRILYYNLTVDWIYLPSAPSAAPSAVIAEGFMHNAPSLSSSPPIAGHAIQASSSDHHHPPPGPPRSQFNTHKIYSGHVPGNVTAIEIKNVTNLRGQFKISVTAVGQAGPSQSSWDVVYYKGSPISDWTVRKILTLFFALFGVILLISLFCVLKHFHEKRQRKKKRQEKFENYEKEESLQLHHIDRESRDAALGKWEIECCSLTLGDAIGQGNFGLVRRATLSAKGKKMVVAVKTLRDGVNDKDVEKLWEEYEILKNLDPHVHVVGLKGIVTKHVPLPLLVVEYCDGGDLQSHLRKVFQLPGNNGRKYSPSGSTPSSGSSSCANFSNSENRANAHRVVTNAAYFLRNEEEKGSSRPPSPLPPPPITVADLLSYARQIACGMEYLSSNKIVHRDLAARNILISGKSRILKISDFGLSRDVYEQNWYKKNSNGEIPIKWLAIECILNEIYTTKSDVWSFGILLWEMFTYGGNPYPGVHNAKVFDLLKDGYRMPRPDICPIDVYELMRICWNDEPQKRPDFTQIRLILEEIIEKTTQVTYLNLESSHGHKNGSSSPRTENSSYFYKNFCADSGFEEYGGSLNGGGGGGGGGNGPEPKLPPRNKKRLN